jgi:tRNA A-37 threonylcarbamoyl transferase component Bud32
VNAATTICDARALMGLGRSVATPFAVDIELDGRVERWCCTTLFRLLPGRRVVARAERNGVERLLKLFVGRGSARQAARERRGADALVAAGVPTAPLLGVGRLAGGGEALLFEFLSGATPLGDLLDAKSDARRTLDEGLAAELLTMLARLHANGLRYRDLHLDNFVRAGNVLYAVDGAAIDRMGTARAQMAIADLGQLLALFRLDAGLDVAEAWRTYADAAGMQSGPSVPATLTHALNRARASRARRYTSKSLRDCSEFRVQRTATRFVAVRRAADDDALRALLHNPDHAMRNGVLRKAGNSATLVALEAGSRRLIVKRYNVKSLVHWLQRSVRPTRAWTSWRNAHRLRMFGVHTAAPVALLEERFGPLRRRGYLVMEELPGVELSQLIRSGEPLPDALIDAVAALLEQLHTLGVVHGDTKASNFIVDGSGVAVIDLDAMASPRRPLTFAAAFRRDVDRLLANWAPGSADRMRMHQALAARGLHP